MKTYIIALFLLLLAGCGTVQPAQVVTETKVELIATPEDLLMACPVTAPPNRELYPKLTVKQKEDVLVNYIGALLKDLSLCNIQIGSIKLFQDLEKKKGLP